MKNLVIISPYPPQSGKYDHKNSALASFSINLLEGIYKNDNKITTTVIADKYEIENVYEIKNNQNLKVERYWQKNDPFIYLKLLWKLKNISKIDKLLVHFEWNVFGSHLYYLICFPFFLLTLKIAKIPTFVVMHGVIKNKSELAMYNPVKANILAFCAHIFYYLSTLSAHQIIVTEEKLRKDLGKNNKINFIPHGVDIDFPFQKKEEARKKLNLNGDFLNIYFGFLAYYKGPDILVNLYNRQNGLLYLVGGPSLNSINDIKYQTYIKQIYEKAKANNIQITGFVDNDKIPIYLNASDLMIFPYRSMLSSSGPLSMSFSFEKPILLSQKLSGYFDSSDFQEALNKTKLKKEDMIFDLNKNDFSKKVEFAKKNIQKLILFSKLMKKKRSWDKIGKMYLKLLQV